MNAYLENMVLTANPIKQVILLYEKAILCLEEAMELMEVSSEDPEQVKRKYEALGRATEILVVLNSTLNMERGGEIAKNLREIYEALISDIVRITAKGDEPETLKKMVKILSNLKEGWEEAEKNIYGRPEATVT
ncbi:MAG: flagellar export chaperone FliS [Aquificaceae bacterium]|nr:flagellar export chaperone FliS [Aquificaceae bacterium]